MPDGANKSSLALEIFGKAGAGMVPYLNQGSAAIIQFEKDSARVAPALSKLEQEVGQKLNNSFDILGKAVASAYESIRLAFAPTTMKVVGALTEFIAANRSIFVEWANDIALKVTPIINDLVAVLQGRDKDVKNTFILTMRDQMLQFASATQHAITDIVIPALAALLGILDTVAQAINGVFGTSLSGQEIAVALVITRMIGLFGVLSSAVSLVVTAVTGLVAVFGGVPVILIALGVAFGVFIANAVGGVQGLQAAWTATWNAIAAIPQTIFDGVVALAQAFVSGIAATWSGLVTATQTAATSIVDVLKSALDTTTGFFTSLVDNVLGAFTKIIAAAKSVGSAISAAFSGGDTSGGDVPGFAGGGRVRGPGTGTSDSILARVSDGEYVMPKRAVDFFGVGFFDALRRLGDPIAALRANLRNFTMPDLLPRYATGGLVNAGGALAAIGGSLQPVHIHFPGGVTAQLYGPQNAVAQFTKAAKAASLRSAGRKPSWFRG
jgi:hypothetical protein